MIEEKRHAAGRAHRTALEQIADFRRGAVAIVRQALDDHRHFVRGETFIDDRFNRHFFTGQARAFFDGALDGLPIDGGFFGLFNGGGQARVQVGIRPAELGRDGDLAHQFDDHLAFFLRADFAPGLFPLCSHESGQCG